MSRATRPRVRARFPIGPWVPGFVLPTVLGLIGVVASVVVLQDLLVVVGVVISAVAALRVRSPAPWLLVVLLGAGQLLRDPDALDAELLVLVLAVHLIVALTLLARVVPVRSRVQLAALGRPALTVVLVQIPAQAIAAVLVGSSGNLQVVPIASTIGGALLVLVAALLVITRRAED